jgi:hypothetical protein
MGLDLAVSAFRECPPADLAKAIAAWVEPFHVKAEPLGRGDVDSLSDVLIFPEKDGWTIVSWPPSFKLNHISACRVLTKALGAVASSVHVPDGLFWVHALVHQGEVVDRYGAMPDFTVDSDAAKERMRKKWAGNARVIGMLLELPPEKIAPYLVICDPTKKSPGKAFKEDLFDLQNYWVFTDFWRKLEISYPLDLKGFEHRLRISPPGFALKLPCSDTDLVPQ